MSESIPLKPMGKEEVRKLELALLIGTLLREDVLEKIRTSEDRLTWLDSLVVAAGSLARERGGYTVEKIADELGRSEVTIRNHLSGKTEASRLVKETYENIKASGGILELSNVHLSHEEDDTKKKLKEAEEKISKLQEKINKVRGLLAQVLDEISKE
ncbi:MAG: transcriptional regulator [Fervidicoccaceae archaeon]